MPSPPKLTTKSNRPSRRTSRTAFEAEPPDPDDPLLSFAPYVHKRPRRNSTTPERQRAFIAHLAATGIVTQAARRIGASLEALYKLRLRPGAEGFAAAWERALDAGIARLEDCALERAILGEERVVVRGGEVVATWRRYDTQLLLFLLRQRRAHRFGPESDPQPGSAAWERLRAQWLAEEPDPDEVLASIDAKLDAMRRNWLARKKREEEEKE